jgi:serine/threonine protein kinase
LADIYSFGMICYEVLTGKVPFEGHQINDYDLVLDGGRPELPDHVPEFLKNIILRCWHADPNSRPRWTDIIQALMQSFDVGDDLVENPERTMDYLVNLESSSARSSVESMIMELKEKVEIHKEELERIEARGFVDHIY